MNRSKEYKPKGEPRYPEMYVGFPERNDATYPEEESGTPEADDERERMHVDPETMTISRKNAGEMARENQGEERAHETHTEEKEK